jgi:putative endonuclease
MKLSKVAIGRDAEHKAIHFLEGKGYTFVASNYRYKRGEIDLIMRDGEILVFIEVKARKSDEYGFPEQWVSAKKLQLIQQTAEEYMIQCQWFGRIRFDIVALSGESGYYHLEDVS